MSCADIDPLPLDSLTDLCIRRLFYRLMLEERGLHSVFEALWPIYNRRVFRGQMQLPQLVVLEHSPPYGQWHTPDEESDAEWMALHPCILRDGYDFFRDTLLHEMCHQFQRQILKDDGPSHSAVWLRLAKTLDLYLPRSDHE